VPSKSNARRNFYKGWERILGHDAGLSKKEEQGHKECKLRSKSVSSTDARDADMDANSGTSIQYTVQVL